MSVNEVIDKIGSFVQDQKLNLENQLNNGAMTPLAYIDKKSAVTAYDNVLNFIIAVQNEAQELQADTAEWPDPDDVETANDNSNLNVVPINTNEEPIQHPYDTSDPDAAGGE